LIEPLALPQVLDVGTALAVKAGGWVIVALAVFVQLLPSVTVTV
jgi:hypothetical protein